MSTGPLRSVTPAIDIYIRLAQYPILCDTIRMRMREELFRRGVVTPAEFEHEVRELAQESQRVEGLSDDPILEDESIWQKRTERVRAYHTDAYFANNLGSALLDQIIEEVRNQQSAPPSGYDLTFNPEIAPWEVLFQQGEMFEQLPPPEREKVEHHLQELKVVLIKRIISDQLPYIGAAKNVFSISDLKRIYQRQVGSGKIGGKAAGMMLAWKALQRANPNFGPDLSPYIEIPDTYFIGSEIIYEYNLINQLDDFMNQKYLSLEEMQVEYPKIVDAYLNGQFPTPIVEQLREYLSQIRNRPIIVRSSSLLEDSFRHPLAGVYNSYLCPNQNSLEENLTTVLNSIRRIYASVFNPQAMIERKKHGLIDYDERMAVLIQELKGKTYGHYFFPTISGFGASRPPAYWQPQIEAKEGCLRLIWGLGTRNTPMPDKDMPCLIALKHPQWRSADSPEAMREYSQKLVDVIDLRKNTAVTLPVNQILTQEYPDLPYIASIDQGDGLQEINPTDTLPNDGRYLITFDYLTRDRRFIKLMRTVLMRLEHVYKTPIEIEFTVSIVPHYSGPNYKLNLLQCRPVAYKTQ